MTDRSINRDGYLLGGGAGEPASAKPKRAFINGGEGPMPYSDRKMMGDKPYWANDTERGNDIVTAKCLACEGKTIDEIAVEMNLPHHVVRQFVAPPENGRETKRQAMATVKYGHLKGRR